MFGYNHLTIMFNLVEHCKTAIYRNLCEKGNLLS